MGIKKIVRKFRRNTRAISPVIATLLMIAIAVVASLVVYAWVAGYIGTQTSNTGKAILIQSVNVDGKVYVQNVGTGTVKLQDICLYIDGTAVPTTSAGTGHDIAEGATYELTGAGAFTPGSHTYTIKVTTTDGTFSQVNKNFPL